MKILGKGSVKVAGEMGHGTVDSAESPRQLTLWTRIGGAGRVHQPPLPRLPGHLQRLRCVRERGLRRGGGALRVAPHSTAPLQERGGMGAQQLQLHLLSALLCVLFSPSDRGDATQIELNGSVVDGKHIRVDNATRQDDTKVPAANPAALALPPLP